MEEPMDEKLHDGTQPVEKLPGPEHDGFFFSLLEKPA